LAIVPYHLSEFGFDNDAHPISLSAIFNQLLMTIGKTLPFSGLTIVFISFFLLGFNKFNLKKLLGLCLWCLLGYFCLLFSYFDAPYPFLYWDIFSFLLVSFLFAYSFGRVSGRLWLAAIFSAVTIFWNFDFFGVFSCGPDSRVAWPLFPWIFVASFFLYFGEWASLRQEHGFFFRLRGLWMAVLLFAVTCLGVLLLPDMNLAPADSGMYCFIQNLSALKKLTIIGVIGFYLVASMNSNLNGFLARTPLALISNSIWNRKFGFAYLLQIVFLGVITSFPQTFMANPLAYDISLMGIFVFTEVVGIAYAAVSRRNKNRIV